MEYFLEQIKLILPVLGFDSLRPLATREQAHDTHDAPTLTMGDVGAMPGPEKWTAVLWF
jgi:hypothetical protein